MLSNYSKHEELFSFPLSFVLMGSISLIHHTLRDVEGCESMRERENTHTKKDRDIFSFIRIHYFTVIIFKV